MYDARFGRWISADPYGQFASPYVGMGNNPVSGTDPNGGISISPQLMEALSIMAETGAFPLPEVVVTATRILDASVINTALQGVITDTDKKLVAFMGGVGNAALNNFTLGASTLEDPSTQAYSQHYANGQTAGHMISFVAGASTTILGGFMAGGGAVLRGSGGAAVLSIPASRAGYALMGLGVSVGLHALGNLDRVHNLNFEGSDGGGGDRVTFGENANQQYHTFRHIEEAGMDKTKVEKVIREDIKKILNTMETGKSHNVQIFVDGKSITYSAYKRPNGIVNVGRIVIN